MSVFQHHSDGPPHCSNPICPNYDRPQTTDWYRKAGFHPTKAFGQVPRFLCKTCGKTFSTQTFSIDYYAKKLVNYRYVYNQINAGAGIRNIARDLEVRDSTVTNRINRLARSALILNQMIVDHLPPTEDLVIDGLQNFCVSQYFPDNYTLVVGKDSQFAYDCDYATLRRCGRMTKDQKEKREKLEKIEKADPKAVKMSFLRLLWGVDRKLKQRTKPLIIYTDEKKDYQRALWDKRIGFDSRMFEGLCRHHTTNSQDARNQKNPLFSVNYFDREIRKDMASHTRETVQFPRNVCNAMLRMYLYMFDHNVRKPYRINNRELSQLRHAQVAGADLEYLKSLVSGFFEKRVFRPSEFKLSVSSEMTVNRRWTTPLKRSKERIWQYQKA
jgi:transposase-like protein